MNKIITKIEEKIKKQKQIPDFIRKIEDLLKNNANLLSESDIQNLILEKLNLEKELIQTNSTLEEKHKNFFYTQPEIMNAPQISWLIPNLIPKQSIGVIIGASGAGKTTFVINCCEIILRSHDNVFIIYIDGDMSANKIKEMGVSELMENYGKRFLYAGKTSDYFSDSAQDLLQDIVYEQEKYPNRIYFVIEDSLTLVAKKTKGFIDTDYLYKHERILRSLGGVSLAIHHKNKAGVFADSQQIVNYADYTYVIERNDFNSCIILHTQKASRFEIMNKAYLTKDRKIISEIDYQTANISTSESAFVHTIFDLLVDGEMNQSEIKKYLKEIAFFSKYGVGEKKVLTWLDKWAKEGRWLCEQRSSEKNAKFYFLDSEKLEKLPNSGEKGVANEPI